MMTYENSFCWFSRNDGFVDNVFWFLTTALRVKFVFFYRAIYGMVLPNIHFLSRAIKGMVGCFPTGKGRWNLEDLFSDGISASVPLPN